MCVYLQALHHRNRSDWCGHGTHALIKGILCLVSANDSPGSPVINNVLVTFFGTLRGLKEQINFTSHFHIE